MDVMERIAGLPELPDPKWRSDDYIGRMSDLMLYVSSERAALLARLALAREWIESSNHRLECPARVLALPCTCGRDALLAALEVPK
jgi:hypothetical protein